MSSGELILVLLVALVVFGPGKLPMLAEHLGILFRHVNRLKQQLVLLWQALSHEQQLQKNTDRALKADAVFEKKES